MAQSTRPDIVSQEDWLKQINLLREKEKSLTRARDEVNALRRRCLLYTSPSPRDS